MSGYCSAHREHDYACDICSRSMEIRAEKAERELTEARAEIEQLKGETTLRQGGCGMIPSVERLKRACFMQAGLPSIRADAADIEATVAHLAAWQERAEKAERELTEARLVVERAEKAERELVVISKAIEAIFARMSLNGFGVLTYIGKGYTKADLVRELAEIQRDVQWLEGELAEARAGVGIERLKRELSKSIEREEDLERELVRAQKMAGVGELEQELTEARSEGERAADIDWYRHIAEIDAQWERAIREELGFDPCEEFRAFAHGIKRRVEAEREDAE